MNELLNVIVLKSKRTFFYKLGFKLAPSQPEYDIQIFVVLFSNYIQRLSLCNKNQIRFSM
jgi:hypothetical protein